MKEKAVFDPMIGAWVVRPKNKFKITEMWAWVSVDPSDGNEGIIGLPTPLGMMPAVGGERRFVEGMRPRIEQLAKRTSQDIKLVRFHTREDVETLESK